MSGWCPNCKYMKGSCGVRKWPVPKCLPKIEVIAALWGCLVTPPRSDPVSYKTSLVKIVFSTYIRI